ncbi:MAG: hypothetical protein KF729_22565 [Sandaracinaceae bacterium]|nr:hypothetical protein [Sandaracinaceae bacterium]
MSAPAAKYFDLVLGVDIHWELVPMPAPTPTPLPNPFVGIVWDPMGTAVGMAINNLVALAAGEPTGRGAVLINGVPAANVGTQARAIVPHILLPPGTGWAPMPGAPMPMIRPSEPPEPPTSPVPTNDAMIVEGADTVTAMGTSLARAGCLAMSCGEPVRLPSSAILPLPIGAPVLVGGPTSITLLDAVLGGMRTRWVSGWLHSLASLLPWRRLRNLFRRGACFLTGHPVDVANGRVLTDHVDFELPGELPLVFERIYYSSWAEREGPLGYGWTHTLHQSVWVEADADRVIYQDEEGRELTFHTHELPDARTRPGDRLYDPVDRLTLVDRGEGRFQILTHTGLTHDFAPVGRADGRAMLTRITDRVGHAITLAYDGRGHLVEVRDAVGRRVEIQNDAQGRIVAIRLPGLEDPVVRYRYDAAGDLVRAWHPSQATLGDDADPSFWYQYQSATPHQFRRPGEPEAELDPFDPAAAANERSTHLLIREIDRNRLTFWFSYDGLSETARCVRTWGDHGIYDHVIRYAERRTHVKNACEELTVYLMNGIGQVVGHGLSPGKRWVEHEYDERTLALISVKDELGGVTRLDYDERGNVVRQTFPDETAIELEYDAHDLPVRLVDPNGSQWRWARDEWGRVKEALDPLGRPTRYGYRDGRLAVVEPPGRAPLEHRYDRDGSLVELRAGDLTVTARYDALGRVTESTDAAGNVTRLARHPLGWVTRVTLADGNDIDLEHDGEGRLLERADHSGRVERFDYDGFAVSRYEHGSHVVRLEHDREERLLDVENGLGERYRLRRNGSGRLQYETGFDGVTRRLRLDDADRVTGVLVQPYPDKIQDRLERTVTYDAMGRVTAIDYADGTFARFGYRADGELVRAVNQDVTVGRELDALGRLVRETVQEIARAKDGAIVDERGEPSEVRARYGPGGERVLTSSLGHYQAEERDEHGLVSRLEVGRERPWSIDFAYDARGLETERRLPTGALQRRRHDALGRPTHRDAYDPEGEPLVEEQYAWGWGEQMTWRWVRGQGATRYAHDDAGALVREDPPAKHVPPIHRARDAAGNLYRTLDRADCRYGPGGRLERAYGATYTHDLAGRLTAIEHPDGTRTELAWSGDGSLRELALPDGRRLAFTYDALGRRVKKDVLESDPDTGEERRASVRFVWDADVLLHELPDDGEPITWVHEPDRFAPLARIEAGRVDHLLTDYLGVPCEGLDADSRLVWQMRLDPYGEAHVDGDGARCPWRWPGQYHDAETGLSYNRFRYYAPGEGRFLSPDPLGLLGGLVPYGYPDDPLWWIDPLGLAKCTRRGVVRANLADWRRLVQVWDSVGLGDIISAANRARLRAHRMPRVDEAWVEWFPGDLHLLNEIITIHHIGGWRFHVPLPRSRHIDAHAPGGFRHNPGGPGMTG